jgi:copper chaperone
MFTDNPHLKSLESQSMNLQFKVPDMACTACATTITNAITAIDPTAQIEADPKTKLVNIETQQPEPTVRQAIVAAGYTIS